MNPTENHHCKKLENKSSVQKQTSNTKNKMLLPSGQTFDFC